MNGSVRNITFVCISGAPKILLKDLCDFGAYFESIWGAIFHRMRLLKSWEALLSTHRELMIFQGWSLGSLDYDNNVPIHTENPV